jgi:hypothetical protein
MSMKLVAAAFLAVCCFAQNTGFRLVFQPDSPQFADATREYQEIWAREGARIVAAMQEVSGLKVEDRAVKAIVLEESSSSGYQESPMRLRASYPADTKKATLVHELGHRMQADFFTSEEEHKYLFLWIYDVWVKLYGKEFADAQVAVERQRGRMYPAAWDFALSFTPAERAKKWKDTVAERTPR